MRCHSNLIRLTSKLPLSLSLSFLYSSVIVIYHSNCHCQAADVTSLLLEKKRAEAAEKMQREEEERAREQGLYRVDFQVNGDVIFDL